MYMTQMYKYAKDGIIYVGSNLPEDVTILETMNILNADDGYEFIRKSDSEKVGVNIWLHDGDVQENYIEIKELQPEQ